jgi:catechol 2,3-dioxygenase-like lactoylglutathione lyase family enzyme
MTLAVRLVCTGFARSLRFYTDVLGFTTMRYAPEQRRAELERDGVEIELVENAEGGLAPLEYPFGRGVTLVVWTQDADAVYSGVQAYGARLHRPMAEAWHEEDGVRVGHLGFEVIDPDGYALRFCQALPPAGL